MVEPVAPLEVGVERVERSDQGDDIEPEGVAGGEGATFVPLEDVIREMLRPMLKSWLDDNLPSLVERIVRAEIERVSRGR